MTLESVIFVIKEINSLIFHFHFKYILSILLIQDRDFCSKLISRLGRGDSYGLLNVNSSLIH